jgi:hypothetical protein
MPNKVKLNVCIESDEAALYQCTDEITLYLGTVGAV